MLSSAPFLTVTLAPVRPRTISDAFTPLTTTRAVRGSLSCTATRAWVLLQRGSCTPVAAPRPSTAGSTKPASASFSRPTGTSRGCSVWRSAAAWLLVLGRGCAVSRFSCVAAGVLRPIAQSFVRALENAADEE